MFFWLSKIFWMLFVPLTLIGLILIAGLCLLLFNQTRNWGRGLLAFGAVIYILIAFSPVGHNMIVLLEKRADQLSQEQPETSQKPQAIILLGGCLNPVGLDGIKQQRSYMNGSCERIIEAIALKNKYDIPLIYSGGNGQLNDRRFTESQTAQAFFEKVGIDKNLLYEELSRNTYENATMLENVEGIDKEQPITLITSASHMPRATAVFCEDGWEIQPVAVDYQTNRTFRILPNLDSRGNILKFNTAFKEYIGLFAYWITGKISLKACAETVD